MPNVNLAELRKEYTLAGLRRKDLLPNPILQFQAWFEAALKDQPGEPHAMTLATVNREGLPSARIVLLRGIDSRGFSFFTNYSSRKGRELEANPNAALVFHWAALERQVCIAGTVSKVSREESELYFQSRPKGSRLAAWASKQSDVLLNREMLEKELDRVTLQHPENVPLPPHWGGFLLAPTSIEFWQGRPSRLHDRFRYSYQSDGNWKIDRLAP